MVVLCEIRDLSASERSVIIMWPVIMLDVRRTAKVIGRTVILTVSIKTRKGAKGAGEPLGTRCAKKEVGLYIALIIVILNHKVKARPKLTIMCLVQEKV